MALDMGANVGLNNAMRCLCKFLAVLVATGWVTTALADGEAGRSRIRLDDAPARLVLIDKSRRQLTLVMHDRRRKVFEIGLGGNPTGHKWREGDSRTPEGDYVIDMKNDDSEYYLSLRISYPNARDMATARRLGVPPGGQIMIHGFPNEAKPPYTDYQGKDWTDGCIAVSNEAMQEIWLAVREKTPVRILP